MAIVYIIWFFLFVLFGSFVLLIHYWSHLLSTKIRYKKEEVSPILKIIAEQWNYLVFHEKSYVRTFSLLLGCLIAWFFYYLGSVTISTSNQSNSIPSFAMNYFSNYFYPSILSPMLLRFFWPILKELSKKNTKALLIDFSQTQAQFFMGLNISLSALSFTLWGVFHVLNFFYVLFHSILIFSYTIYILRKSIADSELVLFYTPSIEEEEWEIEEIKLAEKKILEL